MMAFCELNESVEAVESFDYIEHEVVCPFCEESTILHVESTLDGTYYKCSKCGDDWSVIGG